MLSLLRIYPDWAKEFSDFSKQGSLFEQVVKEICSVIFTDWTVLRVGWSSENSIRLTALVNCLCEHLHTKGATDLQDWITEEQKDGGLDIVCYRKFSDQREAMPTFFLQCASGKNWRTKVQTPNAAEWQKFLNSAVQPGTGIVAPFVVEDKELRLAGLQGQVIVIDRLRMLDVVHRESLRLADNLNEKIIAWVEERMVVLPQAN